MKQHESKIVERLPSEPGRKRTYPLCKCGTKLVTKESQVRGTCRFCEAKRKGEI